MILVVDDNDDIRRVLLKLLRMDGYEAYDVSTGAGALSFLQTHDVLCLILDVHMPEISGFDVLSAVRDDPALKHVRVIMYSAFDGEMADRAMQMGADAFIQKGSLDWAKFKQTLNQLCGPGCANMKPDMNARSANKSVV